MKKYVHWRDKSDNIIVYAITLLIFIIVLACAIAWIADKMFTRNPLSGKKHYHITQFSGGSQIVECHFYGELNYVNNGVWWKDTDSTTIEVTGTIIVQSAP